MIPLAKPSITEREIQAVVKVMESGHLSQGEKVEEFENKFAEYCKVRYAIAVNSGTSGLFLSLKSLGIGRNDRVMTTPYSFVASTNCIKQTGARQSFVDADRDTYNMDVKIMSYGFDSNIKAVVPVDVFGNPFDTTKIQGVPIVLDACESLGSNMNRPFDAAVYAFYPNKQITTGEGGMIVTNNRSVADYCRAMRNQGRAANDTWLTSSHMGYNFRMTDLQSAIGVVQLERINEILEKRLMAYDMYVRKLKSCIENGDIRLQKWENNATVSPFVFTIEVENRDRVLLYLKKNGVESKPYFPSIHLQPYMRTEGYEKGDFPVSEEISDRTLAIPFYTDITEEEIDYVCSIVKEAMAFA